MLILLLNVLLCSLVYGQEVVINTWGSEGFLAANKRAIKSLGGSAMYALVEGLSSCENAQCEGTVGYGGSPDEKGETTLDAMVMDGKGLKIGAVADLRQIKDAARVAWAVLNYTKHTMLAGEGAREFAEQMGFKPTNLSTDNSEKIYTNWIQNKCQPNFWKNVEPNPRTTCGPYTPLNVATSDNTVRPNVDSNNHDTIGMVVIKDKEVVAGTSTNGANHKIPGRVGDSPIPGSGAYAMEGVGGAASTGDGDIMMRMLPSYLAVTFLEAGTKPMKAARKVMEHMLRFYPDFKGAIVTANMKGHTGAACANLSIFAYSVSNGTESTVEHVKCIKFSDVPTKKPRGHRDE